MSRAGLVEKALSLSTAILQHASAGFIPASKEVVSSRLNICGECDLFDPEIHFCNDCGCYMPAKVYIASASCPLKPPKWGKANIVQDDSRAS